MTTILLKAIILKTKYNQYSKYIVYLSAVVSFAVQFLINFASFFKMRIGSSRFSRFYREALEMMRKHFTSYTYR